MLTFTSDYLWCIHAVIMLISIDSCDITWNIHCMVARYCYLSLQGHYASTYHIDGLMQEWRNSSALAVELRLSCTNPSISGWASVCLLIFPLDQIACVIMNLIKKNHENLENATEIPFYIVVECLTNKWYIGIQLSLFMEMHLKISSVKWQPLCPGGEGLINN